MTGDPEIQRALGRIEGKIDGVLLAQSHQHVRLNDYSDRLEAVEKKVDKRAAMVAGGAAVITSLISWFGLDFFTRGQ